MTGVDVSALKPTEPRWDSLLAEWMVMDHPEGWRIEILFGRLVLTPMRDTNHALTASDLMRQL